MRNRTFVLVLVGVLILAAAAYALHRPGGGILKRWMALHGPRGH
jgi:hypothetical protein